MSIPTHVAIIMDGNGRWAQSKGYPRMHGHRRGLDVAEQIIDCALQLRIKYLSLYVFSTENWKRPEAEVASLFGLADKYLSRFEKFAANRVRVVVSGDINGLPAKLAQKIVYVSQKTAQYDAICVNLCINYGGQNEIVTAVKKLNDAKAEITVESIKANLYNNLPDPDLIIRTGGQKRLSNFLLFQSAYSELYFSDTLWPEFTCNEFTSIIQEYGRRKRNFGGIADA